MPQPSNPTSPMSAWLIGLFLGAVDGLVLLELGFIGMLLTFAAVLLIAWKGPCLPAMAGLVAGVGLAWALLLANALLNCAAANSRPGESCEMGSSGLWLAAAGAMVLLGAAGTVLAARRARRDR